MKISIWGCRGSLPASVNAPLVRKKIVAALETAVLRGVGKGTDINAFVDRELPFSVRGSYGSNTCCVEVSAGGGEFLIIDCGSGLRDLGNHVFATKGPRPQVYNICITHLHWDHLMGFPFFTPAYVPGNVIRFYGCHEGIEHAMRTQMSEPFFPVPFDALGADIEFHSLTPGEPRDIAGVSVMPWRQDHPGASYGYRMEHEGKVFVMSTDSEHRQDMENPAYPFLDFVRDADLLIFDAQYTFQAASTSKQDWGHSSNIVGVELAKRAGVKRLCMFHQEPTLDDASIEAFHKDTKRYSLLYMPDTELEILMAYDGLAVSV
ncbi:MBL fold metallo-hydrolase [Desulfocurvus sp. DL9XJH121]